MGFWGRGHSSSNSSANAAPNAAKTEERRGRSSSPAPAASAASSAHKTSAPASRSASPSRSTQKPAAPSQQIFKDAHPITMEDILGVYKFGQTLGKGAFSEVKQAKNRRTGEEVAVKIIDKASCAGKEGMIQTEVSILRQINHPHIIPLYDMYETEHNILLVMQMVTGGELFESIVSRGKYTEHDAAQIICRIIQAVDYLHKKGIAHRDLKPENLLYSSKDKDAKIMISDFGLSKIFSDMDMMKTACGTPGYVAPEVLKRTGYGKEVDMWSIGVITYILLSGYPPFYEENNLALFQLIMKGQYKFDSPWWDDISSEAKDFVARLLVVDPRRRMMCRAALKHPFVREHCGDLTDSISEEAEPVVAQHTVSSSTDIKAPVTAHRRNESKSDKNLAPIVIDKLKKTIEGDRNSKASIVDIPQQPVDTSASVSRTRSTRVGATAVVTEVCAESSTSTAVSVTQPQHTTSRSRSVSPTRRRASIHDEETPEPRALKAKERLDQSTDSGLGDSVSLTAVNRLSISRLVI